MFARFLPNLKIGMASRLQLEMQVVLCDKGILVPDFCVQSLTENDRKNLLRFADVVSDGTEGAVLRQNRRLRIGRTIVENLVVVSPPPMATDHFLSMLYLALGGKQHHSVSIFQTGGTNSWVTGMPDAFLTALAVIFLEEAERILHSHISKKYVNKVERRSVLSGRPLWIKDFGQHPTRGISCVTNTLTTDTLHNSIVLEGLFAARRLLQSTAFAERLENQVFIWRTLASSKTITAEDFNLVGRETTRFTEHYSTAITLSRAIVGGAGMPDVFTTGNLATAHFELSLPGLFEQLVLRLFSSLQRYGIEARFKCVDTGAFISGDGETYRKVEPDITLWREGRPIAVIDAKFKPRYLNAQLNGSVVNSDKVTSEDLYQLFFYQSRLQANYAMSAPPAAFILAPKLDFRPLPTQASRTIYWRSAQGHGNVLSVESTDFPKLTESLRLGSTEDMLGISCPGFLVQLTDILNRS